MFKIKKISLIFTLLLVLCSCSAHDRPVKLVLDPAEHPELDFGYADGERIIRDFAVGDNKKIYILQNDGIILEYSRRGKFESKYDLKLSEQGLTAYKIAYGNGKAYLLDGHNNAIITAQKERITNVSSLSFSDVGLVKSFCTAENGMLAMSFADPEQAYTVQVDPSGKEAKITGEKQKGYLLDSSVTYLPELIYDKDGAPQIKITVYNSVSQTDGFVLRSSDEQRSPVGLGIYGLSDGCYYGLLHEFVNYGQSPETEQYVQTVIRVDPQDKKIMRSASTPATDMIIDLSPDGSYFMKISDDSLTVLPISEYFTDWTEFEFYQCESYQSDAR